MGESSLAIRVMIYLTLSAMPICVGDVRQFCKLQDEGQSLMRATMSHLNLSARAYHPILKLSRIIADLAGSEEIDPHT